MSNIKEAFVSRFDNGVIMEADFSQLEVVGQAIVTKDKQLKQDLLDGLDMHLVSASWVTGKDYDWLKQAYDSGDPAVKKARQEAKRPRFELQYGAGVKTIAHNNGWSEQQAKDYIDRYYDRYPGVKKWQDDVARSVEMSAKPTGVISNSGDPHRRGFYKSITGRYYVFNTMESDYQPKWGKREPNFSPTQMKNYPIQGFATGDIVPEVLGRLYRGLVKHRDKVLLINTIHDSIVFDVNTEAGLGADLIAGGIKDMMQDAPRWMKERFGVEIDIPLKVDVEYGDSWKDCK